MASTKKILRILSKNAFIKNIITYFPLFYVTIVIYGFIAKSSYYYIIDIDITEYISLGELLFPSIKFIEFVYIFLGISVVLIIGNHKKSKDKKTYNAKTKQAKKAPKWIDLLLNILEVLFYIWPLIFGAALFASNYLILNSIYFKTISYLWPVILFGIVFVFISNIKSRTIINLSTALALYLIMFTIYVQVMIGNSVLKGNPSHKIEIINDGKSTITTDSLVYYGKTSSYIFMRDLVTEKTRIFNLNLTSTISIEKLRNGFFPVHLVGRDWSEHSVYNTVSTKTEINEYVEKIERRSEIFIINDKFLLPKSVKIHSKGKRPKWFRTKTDEYLLYKVDAPYFLIKNKNDFEAIIIKDYDTLTVTNNF